MSFRNQTCSGRIVNNSRAKQKGDYGRKGVFICYKDPLSFCLDFHGFNNIYIDNFVANKLKRFTRLIAQNGSLLKPFKRLSVRDLPDIKRSAMLLKHVFSLLQYPNRRSCVGKAWKSVGSFKKADQKCAAVL